MTNTPTPLEYTDMRTILDLGHVLWSWPLCTDCVARRKCVDTECVVREPQLKRYHQFYRALINSYIDESFKATRVFKTHEDIFQAIQALRDDPNRTRQELADFIDGFQAFSPDSMTAAINLAVKILTMVDCSTSHLSSCPGKLEQGRFRVPWRDHVRFSDYIQDLFPKHDGPSLGRQGSSRFSDIKSALRATRLQKNLRVTLRPTHDLRDHLQFDRKNRIVDIFHLTTFLKEQLKLTRDVPAPPSPNNLNLSTPTKTDILPRHLILETLTSIQEVLFPLSDRKSRQLLDTLISSADFDPDAARFESATIRKVNEGNTTSYIYLADRIEDLYEETLHPRPNRWVDRVLERKSGARHVMCVTIGGVIVALFLGAASLAVGIFQAVVAYLAWKYPASST